MLLSRYKLLEPWILSDGIKPWVQPKRCRGHFAWYVQQLPKARERLVICSGECLGVGNQLQISSAAQRIASERQHCHRLPSLLECLGLVSFRGVCEGKLGVTLRIEEVAA